MEGYTDKKAFNYYVHLVSFIADDEHNDTEKNKALLKGNIEMVVVLIHYIQKDRATSLKTGERTEVR